MGSKTSQLEEKLKKACQTRQLSLSGLQLKDLNQVISLCSIENKKRSSWIPLYQSHIHVLDLSNNQLKILPNLKFIYMNLRMCSLSSNQFENLPSYFCFAAKFLKRLDLSNNHLINLPEEILELSILSELDVSNNLLKSLPRNLSQLERLEVLNLEGNQLEHLIDLFGLNWINLGELNLKRNQLRKLPHSCQGWIKMRCILLDMNYIDFLPQDIFQSTPHLIKLSLETNPIQIEMIQNLPDYEKYTSRRKDQIDKRVRANLHNIKMIHPT